MAQSGAHPQSLATETFLTLLCHQETNQKLAALNGLKYSVWVSRGAGLVLAYDGGLILVPMLRNIIRFVRPKLAWLFPADENIWFHRQVAYSMAFWAMVHTTAHYVNFINVEITRTSTFILIYARMNIQGLCRGTAGESPRHSLHPSWSHHRPLHAPHHALDVHHGTPQDAQPVL